MKKRITIILAIVFMLMAGTAWSAPFLVCDCQEVVNNYELIFDSLPAVLSDAVDMDCPAGQKRLSFDIAPLAFEDGAHVALIKAKNDFGASEYVTFEFNTPVAIPSDPTGFRLSPTP